jgi:TetR/AcrR family tetracycline transcriptional repressor
LDQEQIVLAALDLLDEVGLDGLSMRRLAERLGIKAASLYWHVRNKEHLLQLLADAICAPVREPDPTLSWRKRLEALGQEYRRVLRGHRDAGRVLASSGPPTGPHRLRLVEMVLAALLDAGFTHGDAAHAAFVLNDYVTLFLVEEAAYARAVEKQASDSGELSNWREALRSGEFPSIAALADHLVEIQTDERFLFGLEVLLNGLETRLAQTRARASGC